MRTITMEKRFEHNLDYDAIIREAREDGYKWFVMKRDAYRGNCDTDYFLVEDFDEVYEKKPYYFFNEERPVYAVIITNVEPDGYRVI